jgi:alpha-L-rhamnosidase
MSKMCSSADTKDTFSSRADHLKDSIISHLWNGGAGIMRMSDIVSPTGICQDINAYAITIGVSPFHSKSASILAAPKDSQLPLAFQGIERWDQNKVVSPYASGFSAEALFERNQGLSAIELLERVWGVMADETNPNYSGGHWEAMKPDGTPMTDDTSLMHGWSTWPVYLLPRYLGGIEPLEPGWSRWKVKPVLVGLESVDVQLSTPPGRISVALRIDEASGTGKISLRVSSGTVAEVFAPEGWTIVTPEKTSKPPLHFSQTVLGQDKDVITNIEMLETGAFALVLSKKGDVRMQTEELSPACSLKKSRQSWFNRPTFLKRLQIWLK